MPFVHSTPCLHFDLVLLGDFGRYLSRVLFYTMASTNTPNPFSMGGFPHGSRERVATPPRPEMISVPPSRHGSRPASASPRMRQGRRRDERSRDHGRADDDEGDGPYHPQVPQQVCNSKTINDNMPSRLPNTLTNSPHIIP